MDYILCKIYSIRIIPIGNKRFNRGMYNKNNENFLTIIYAF